MACTGCAPAPEIRIPRRPTWYQVGEVRAPACWHQSPISQPHDDEGGITSSPGSSDWVYSAAAVHREPTPDQGSVVAVSDIAACDPISETPRADDSWMWEMCFA
ncbi:hypothetical protein VZT92_008337 [Zoarces viviparus]|uniref:Uncharacterized protein n=1 Tax=Zoarces viviparus TaxID=48416 RepID=A0AAW1FET9_ZOAVI